MNYTDVIFSLIEKENKRQKNGIELIASENYVSDDVLKAAGSILTNKYAEGYPNKRYYGGCKFIDDIESIAIERLKKLFGVEYANVQPHSGSQANSAVYLAILNPSDKILAFNLSHGGHLTHGASVSSSGKLYDPYFYGVNKDTYLIDYDAMSDIANKEKPKLIICGASSYSRDIDFKKIREIADNVNALVMADISHTSGLICSGLLNSPIEHCHVVTSTTHKTLRGPRGGIIMMGKDFSNPIGKKTKKGKLKNMSTLINAAVFPGIQGGPLEHIIAAKAIAFKEADSKSFVNYAKKIKENAKYMSELFINMGYKIISGGTDNHCFVIDFTGTDISGQDAEDILEQVGITTNKNMIPFDTLPPNVTSGLRIGTPAITTRGLEKKDIKNIVRFMDKVLKNKGNDSVISKVKKDVNDMMSVKPLFVFEN